MKNILLILLVAFFFIDCSNNTNLSHDTKLQREKFILDSIKKDLNNSDSINLLYYDTTGFKIFIDYNLNSEFHKEQIEDFSYPIYSDTAFFNESYKKQKSINPILRKVEIPSEIKKIWIPVYKYQEKFYPYCDCDFQHRFAINDTTFEMYGMMPVEPEIIDDFQFSETGFEIVSNTKEKITFNEIDKENSIYILKFKNYCEYVIPIDRIRKFPIMVVICGGGLTPISGEIEFKRPECNN